MSYLFYTVFAGAIAIVVGSLTSLICKEKCEDVNPMLFAPFIRKFLKINEINTRTCVTHAFKTMDTINERIQK